MIGQGTMRTASMQVAVLGSSKVGRSTFLKSLQSAEAKIISNDVIEVPVRDIANNIQLNLTFRKCALDNGSEEDRAVVAQAACLLIFYDVSQASSFQHATQILYPIVRDRIS